MAEVKEFEEKIEIEELKEEPITRTIIPEICTYENEDSTGYIIEVILPGVEKDTIKLKMNKNYYAGIIKGLFMPRNRSIDIDTQFDFDFVDFILKTYQ